MAKSVRLSNGRHFRIQGDAMAHFKAMLDAYKLGEDVTNADHVSDLSALIEAYDNGLPTGVATKTGTGIAGFSRQANRGEGYVTEGFHVHRTDGTRIDFSYKEAVRVASNQGRQ